MTTRTHRFVRKLAPFLNKIEPIVAFVAYIAAGGMAFFALFFPPNVSSDTAMASTMTEGALLAAGSALGLWGAFGNKPLVEFWGVCCVGGGLFITLCSVMSRFLYDEQYNYGQFVAMIFFAMSLLISHGFTLYHEITESWINLPPSVLNKIYER